MFLIINYTQTNYIYNKIVNLTLKTSKKNKVKSYQKVALYYLLPYNGKQKFN
jgi:hypothetical protein